MSNEVTVGAGQNWAYRTTSREEVLNSNPQPPVFEDDLEDVEKRVTSQLRKLKILKNLERPHRKIRALLDEDDRRREKARTSSYVSYWDKPYFDELIERRRLTILNGIFTALEQSGMRPYLSGKEARDLSVMINDTDVSFWLDSTSQKDDRHYGNRISTRGDSTKLKFVVSPPYQAPYEAQVWGDEGRSRIESKIKDIVIALIVEGERQHRFSEQRHYEWMVKRKADLIEEIRKEKEEAERRERERQIQLEKARVDRLLTDASALRQAADIRAYVKAVQILVSQKPNTIESLQIEQWSNWALAQADRADPVKAGKFLEAMKDPDEFDEDEGGS